MMKKYPINKPFKPSIKLEPLTNIIKQKVVNKKLKRVFSKILSIKLILVGVTSSFNKYTNEKIIISCKRILILGEDKIFPSEKSPMRKIDTIV